MEFARNPYWRDRQDCVVFDENAYHGKPVTQSSKDKSKEFCKVSMSYKMILCNIPYFKIV